MIFRKLSQDQKKQADNSGCFKLIYYQYSAIIVIFCWSRRRSPPLMELIQAEG